MFLTEYTGISWPTTLDWCWYLYNII